MFSGIGLLLASLLALSPLTSLPQAVQAAPPVPACTSERMTIPSFDGYPLAGKLYLPRGQNPQALVVYVNGSGPNTYENTRALTEDTTFSYFDLVAQGFTGQNAAFFSYSTRGVAPGSEPPYYCTIDPDAYQTYLPDNSVRDVAAIVAALRQDPRLSRARVYLLGWSEGTMIAPKAAQIVPVDGLLLAGYVNGTMRETLDWQQSGGSSMITYCLYFDTDGDGAVSRAEYEADPYGVRGALGLDQTAFPDLDVDGDGKLTAADFSRLLAPTRQTLYAAIDRGDDAWLAQNYPVRLTTAWFRAHDAFPPNRDMLTTLDIPITIFQGEADANVPVQDTREIQAQFAACGKTNLTVHTYPATDHDLNFSVYLSTGEWPQGWQDLFAAVR